MAELGNRLRSSVGVTPALTVEGAVHVFGQPDSDADRVLASEGNYLREPRATESSVAQEAWA